MQKTIGPVVENDRMKEKNIILEVRHLTKRYAKKNSCVEAVLDVSVQLYQGQILGIVGESGSGKSTLLRQIACLEQPDEGRLFLKGAEITGKKTRDICGEMQMVFQHAAASFNPRRKISASLDEMLKVHTKYRGQKLKEKRAELIQMVGLQPELAERYPLQLSGGQCQRMAIARALAANPVLLLCDEITSALDMSAQAQIVNLLNNLRRQMNLSVIFVSHDLALTGSLCENLIVMENGICVEAGRSDEILKEPKQAYTRRLLDSVLTI